MLRLEIKMIITVVTFHFLFPRTGYITPYNILIRYADRILLKNCAVGRSWYMIFSSGPFSVYRTYGLGGIHCYYYFNGHSNIKP